MTIDTTFYERCISTLQKANELLLQSDAETNDHDMYRSACIKEFEIILEQSGKLLKKVLKPYFHSSKEVDKLYFKDLFRHAVLRDMMSEETAERWNNYLDSRNSTAHDYGVDFAENTLHLLPQFVVDATAFAKIIKNENDAASRKG